MCVHERREEVSLSGRWEEKNEEKKGKREKVKPDGTLEFFLELTKMDAHLLEVS